MLWLIVSGLFFLSGLALHIALIVAAVKAMATLQSLQPQIKTLVGRVDDVAKKVDDISEKVKGTVDSMTNRAEHVAENFETAAFQSGQNLGKIATVLATALAGIKLYKEFASLRKVDKP